MNKGPYSLTSPCDNCPFRTDVRAYLNEARVREIEDGLVRGEFPCHKTVTYGNDGEPINESEHIHCAGALILLEKLNQPSQMMRISWRLNLYDPSKLDMTAPVFDSFDDMADAQPVRRCKAKAAALVAAAMERAKGAE